MLWQKSCKRKVLMSIHYFSLGVTYILVVMMSMTLKRCNELMVFLYYLYFLDMEITTTNYVAITDTILDYLRQQGVEAVAACDYEEKLRKQ